MLCGNLAELKGILHTLQKTYSKFDIIEVFVLLPLMDLLPKV